MLDTQIHEMRELEDHYWWFVARRRIALALLDDAGLADPRMLDCGVGAGALLQKLGSRGTAFGIDIAQVAIDVCRGRGLERLVRSDVTDAPFRAESFDAAMLLDVLEHVEDDQAALDETVRLLRPGGVLVIAVPALKILWGVHDEALGHHRR
ncbi:MAG TPA: class I SAM-dependent methyltransferase, partial [Dehalococcoidia bacterium]|nr:class I SAM-dependent methyltransferase [Dehalococcoidia bacterium]